LDTPTSPDPREARELHPGSSNEYRFQPGDILTMLTREQNYGYHYGQAPAKE
jgi:hypothetical protein